MHSIVRISTAVLLLASCLVRADITFEYVLPPAGSDIIGQNRIVTTAAEDTLVDIAARHQLGINLLRSANPEVDPWLPGDGTAVLLPRETILPQAERNGIVVNVAEMRLYHFYRSEKSKQPSVNVYSVSVGRGEWSTPLTRTRVTGRVENPVWYPPASVRAEHAARGDRLPRQVPPGPDNPLGRYILSLGIPSYFIHGTNRPNGIGMQVTHGCIRMYPQNIEQLVRMAPNNTPVTIVNQPFKVGWNGDALYLEVHKPLEKDGVEVKLDTTEVVYALIEATQQSPDTNIDWNRIEQVIEEAAGLPRQVGMRPAGSVASSS